MISSDFDIYHHGNRLIYVRNQCSDGDTRADFFLHIIPVDEDSRAAERDGTGGNAL